MEPRTDDQAGRRSAAMPDVTVGRLDRAAASVLDEVGMAGMAVALRWPDPISRLPSTVAGLADGAVSLDDPQARGIHMSRIYLAIQEVLARQELTWELVLDLLERFLASHHGVSRRARFRLAFDLLASRQALATRHRAWRTYPVEVAGRLDGGVFRPALTVTVAYASTCPCSAALARQAVREAFTGAFGETGAVDAAAVAAWLESEPGMAATPHAQRSLARVTVVPRQPAGAPAALDLIDRVEAVLGTPVQAAVKRADERAFARANAANLMFCEDAARRLRAVLDDDAALADWRVEVRHCESLHAHDAVAVAVRGVAGGLTA